MGAITGQLSYWRCVFVRAFDDALAFLGTNRRKAVLGIIVTPLAAAGLAYWFSAEKAVDKLIWAGLTLAAFWVIFFFVYVLFLVRTPYLLHRELSRVFGEQVRDLQTTATSLESEKALLTNEVARARISDPQTSFRRHELEKLVDRFRRLITSLEASQHLAVEEFYSADMAGKNFVEREFPSYSEYAVKYPFRNTHTTKARYDKTDFDAIICICRDRIKRFEELLSHFG